MLQHVDQSFESVNEVQLELYQQLLNSGSGSSPRGMQTRELLFVGFELRNPRKRITTLRNRRFSSRLAVGELCWHLRGSQSATELSHYAPRWMDFADQDGKIRGSCYGHKIFEKGGEFDSQWTAISNLLKDDPDSRRAVLSFHGADFSERASHSGDVACVSSLQFFVRDKRLYAMTIMRSNDVFWGLPYDVFIMTVFQEMMATELGLGLGSYYHHCGSLHVYEDKAHRLRQVLDSTQLSADEMAPMTSLDGREPLLNFEEAARLDTLLRHSGGADDFWQECQSLLVKSLRV